MRCDVRRWSVAVLSHGPWHCLLCLCVLVFGVRAASAQSVIKRPGEHPGYSVELEPHLAAGLFGPPGLDTGEGFGPGLRLSFPVAPNGFLSKVNDSVAIGTGLDWVFYDADFPERASCARFVSAPNMTRVCAELGPAAGDANYFFIPVVMQWNFWFHKRVSAFGEPGMLLYVRRDGSGDSDLGPGVVFQLGGRWHFADRVALTGRLGFPTSSIGFSFLL